jgi:hypothetical protein
MIISLSSFYPPLVFNELHHVVPLRETEQRYHLSFFQYL